MYEQWPQGDPKDSGPTPVPSALWAEKPHTERLLPLLEGSSEKSQGTWCSVGPACSLFLRCLSSHALPLTLSLGLQQPQAWLIRASPPLAPGLNPGGGCPHGQPKSTKPGTPVRLLLKSPLFPWARSRVWLIRPQPATVQGP